MKKIYYLFVLAILLYVPSANALTCTKGTKDLIINTGSKTINVDLSIPSTIHTIIVVLKIAVPVLLVILGTLDLLKGVTADKEDEIKKSQQLFFKRLIAAVIVFFVITVVQMVISFADTNNEGIMDCANCFINNKCGGSSNKTKNTVKPATGADESKDPVKVQD